MSTDATVHVGYYVVAKMKETTEADMELQCTLNSKHSIVNGAKFCSKCGSKITDMPVERSVYQSILGVMYDSSDFAMQLDNDNKQFLLDKFEGIESEWIGYEAEGYEIVMMSDFNTSIDGDYSSVTNLPINSPSKAMKDEYLRRLQHIMEYESVELRYGVLIQYS